MNNDPEVNDEEAVVDDPQSSKDGEKGWKRFQAQEYRAMAAKLVHFSSKTVNSNASPAGIRLANDAAIDLPYVSARTLMSSGMRIPLDYLEGGAAQAGKMKQINAVVSGSEFARDALPEERDTILEAVRQASEEGYFTGISLVDSRLRQLLVPTENSEEGYVSITPVTSGGVCDYLLNSDAGLVRLHNAAVKDEKVEGGQTRKNIAQAQFGIGGANPQNVGSLVRSMTRPIFLRAPLSDSSIKRAFGIYFKGFSISVSSRSSLWEQLQEYRAFRSQLTDSSSPLSATEMRSREQLYVKSIVENVLAEGAEALSCLMLHQHALPQECLLPNESEGYELISRKVPGVIRGLVDRRLREFDYSGSSQGRQMDWPREAAEYITSCILKVKHKIEGEEVPLIPLDKLGRNSLVSMMEDVLS